MVTDLSALADRLQAEAADHPRGRAAQLVVSGDRMRVTMMAMRAGEALGEHEAPPAATLQVLRGQATLHADGEAIEVNQGELSAIPPARHDLVAVTDMVAVLTASLEV